jgi:ABC-type phosphate transport system auxiliary subunit
MNAYELANKMEQLAGHFHNEAINMLRQQADEIGSLKARLKQLAEEIGCYKIELELHKAMIQDLEKGLESSLALNKAQAERKAS